MNVKYKIMNQISYENLIMLKYVDRIFLARANALYYIYIKIHRRNANALVLITTKNSIFYLLICFIRTKIEIWKKIKGHFLKCLYFVLSHIDTWYIGTTFSLVQISNNLLILYYLHMHTYEFLSHKPLCDRHHSKYYIGL